MPPTPDFSFAGLDEYVNKLVVKNYKAKSSEEEPKVDRNNDDVLIIEEWVSDNEKEDVSQPKIEMKKVRPDEYVNKLVVKNYKAKSSEEEPKVDRKNDDVLIIEEWVSDNEKEDVSQPKIEMKKVRPGC
nr:hypothetical protein [Tanacetum cinerariifolium]